MRGQPCPISIGDGRGICGPNRWGRNPFPLKEDGLMGWKKSLGCWVFASLFLLCGLGAVYPSSLCATKAPNAGGRSASCALSGCYTQTGICNTTSYASFNAVQGSYEECVSCPYGCVYSCQEDATVKACLIKDYFAFANCLGPTGCTNPVNMPDCTTL